MIDRIWQLAYIVAYRLAKCWWWLRRPPGRGSYVAVWFDDRILIIRNSYKHEYCVPAGGVDRGENFLQAAVRELYEEVGIAAEEADLIRHRQYENFSEFKHDVSELFVLRLSAEPNVIIDNREVVFAKFMTLSEAVQLPLVPVVNDYLREVRGEPCDSQNPAT